MNKGIKTKELFETVPLYLKALFEKTEYPWEILPQIKGYAYELMSVGIMGYKLLKEGVLVGGFGAYLEEILKEEGLLDGLTVKKIGVGDTFVPHGNTSLLLSRLGLGEEEIKKEVPK